MKSTFQKTGGLAIATLISLIGGLALIPNVGYAVAEMEIYEEITLDTYVDWTALSNVYEQQFSVYLADENVSIDGTDSNENTIYPNLKPGFAYTMSVDGAEVEIYDLRFDVDQENYRLYIDGWESYRLGEDLVDPMFSLDEDFEIMLECISCTDSKNVPAGYATKMVTSGGFIWEVSMGRLSNGESAGKISIREDQISSNIFSPSTLIYHHNSSEVKILRESSTLRQIKAHQALADINTVTDGYEIKFYPSEDVGSKTGSGCGGGGCYDVSGADPFVAFKFKRQTPGNNDKLEITRTRYDSDPDETWVTNVEDTSGVWATTTEDDLRKVGTTNSTAAGVRTEETEVKLGATPYTLATRTVRKYETIADEERVVEVIEDPDDASTSHTGKKFTTKYDYYTTSSEEATYGKKKWVEFPNGNWERYTYHTTGNPVGQPHKTYRPVEDAPTDVDSADATNQNKTRTTIYDWDVDWDGAYVLPKTIEVTVGDGTTGNSRVSYTEFSHGYDDTFNSEPIHVVTRKDHYKKEDGEETFYYTTVTASYRPDADQDLAKKMIYVKNPDQSMRYTAYEEGAVTYNGTSKQWEFDESSQSPDGWMISTHYGTSTGTTAFATIDTTAFYMVDEKSHKEVVIIDARGHSVRTEMHIYDTGSTGNFALAGYTDSLYNDAGKLYESNDDRGRKYTASWFDGLRTTETDANGTVADFSYDALGRVVQADRTSATVDSISIPSVRTYYSFDASSRVIKKEVGTSSKITTERVFDYAGRLESMKEFSTAGSAYRFTTSYTYANGGRTVTVTKPGSGTEGGGTAITANYYDGRVKSLEGTGVIHKHYDYGVDASDYEWTTVRVGEEDEEESTRKTTTTYNWVGNVIKEEWPTDDGGTDFKREYFYSPDNYPSDSGKSFLSRITEKELADQYFKYDTMGRRIKEGLDAIYDEEADYDYTALVANSNDRIIDTDVKFHKDTSNKWWVKVEKSVYGIIADGTPSSDEDPVLISKTLDRLTGFATNVVAESYIYDAHNSESSKIVRTTEIDRSSKKRLEKVNYPDSSTIDTTTFGNGLLIKNVSAQNVTTKTYYDAWGRIDKVNDRTGDHVDQNKQSEQ